MSEENKKNEDIQKKPEQCEKERDEYLDGWKRAKADFSNYKKEEAFRFEQFARLSNEAIVSELLVVLDSFRLGLAIAEEDNPAKKGMLLIKNQLEETLKKYGLEKILVKIGDTFNPSEHEAISEIASDAPPGTIAEEVETGYKLHTKVVRPTKVKLAKELK